MQEPSASAAAAASVSIRPARPAQKGIPPTKALRERLLSAVQEYARAEAPVPPLSLEELRHHAERVASAVGADGEYAGFLAVLINNEVWRDRLAGIPYHRRLLLLPKCLRDGDRCQGRLDAIGLTCGRCGQCPIHDLQAEAERLGYVVLVAEGSPVVMGLLESGQVEAVVGVSCLSVLERVFPYMHAGAVPGIAIPLLNDGCLNTSVDLDWVWDAVQLTRQAGGPAGRLDLDALRRQVEGWFTPEAMVEVLGPAVTQTERIARRWMALSGKRWRPLLAVCAYQALHDRSGGDRPLPASLPEAGLPDDVRRIAFAVECFHKASLVHDDIEDDDRMRYQARTVHVEHGVPVALNVGDLLLGEGYRLIAECNAPAVRKAEMLRAAAEGHRTLCLGQGEELCWRRTRRPLGVQEVLDIFRRKTAPAFEVALRLGATYAGAGENVWEVLCAYSQALGVAYQIRDDLADFLDGPDGSDAQAARPSILLAIAHQCAGGPDRDRLEAVWRGGGDLRSPRQPDLRKLLADLDVPARAERLLETHKHQAVRALIPLGSAELKGLLRRVITRIFDDTTVMGCCNDYRAGDAPGGPASQGAAG